MTLGTHDIQLARFKFKGIWAVVASVVVIAGGTLYLHHRKQSLREQGARQVEEYLATELPARLIREGGARRVSPRDLEAVKKVEIVEFATRWFPRDKTRVRVEVKTPLREFTYHFTFRRRFGSWVLDSQASAGIFGP